jgi:bifunctional non-homologous end joining protein LigD
MVFATTVKHALSRFGLHERGDAPFPRQPAPMLVEKAAALFDDPAWTYEPKWDGFRVLATVRDSSVRLISRNGHSFTNLFWPISDALRGFPTSIPLDGEVIVITDKGQPDFEALPQRLRPRNGKLPGYLCYMVFDCLYVNGHSLMGRPLEERQAILRELQPAPQGDTVKLTEGFPAGKAKRLMKAYAMMGLEGVVMKRKASIYRPGFQTSDWLRVPIRHREEFVIGGYLPGPPAVEDAYSRAVRQQWALRLCWLLRNGPLGGYPQVILEELKATPRKTCPFPTAPVLRDDFHEVLDIQPQWVKPSMVVEVEYRHA